MIYAAQFLLGLLLPLIHMAAALVAVAFISGEYEVDQ